MPTDQIDAAVEFIIKALVKDICGRRGIGDEWEAIEADIMKGEILPAWRAKIREQILKCGLTA